MSTDPDFEVYERWRKRERLWHVIRTIFLVLVLAAVVAGLLYGLRSMNGFDWQTEAEKAQNKYTSQQ